MYVSDSIIQHYHIHSPLVITWRLELLHIYYAYNNRLYSDCNMKNSNQHNGHLLLYSNKGKVVIS